MADTVQKTGYGKKPLPQRLVIFSVIAFVIFGLLYIFFFAKNNNYQSNYYQRPPQQTHSTLANRSATIPLKEENNSGESGSVTFKQDNGVFTINISLTSKTAIVSQPASLQVGKCLDIGKVKFTLNPIVNGKSTTSLQMSFDQLKKMEPLMITVHKSENEKTKYTACGEIKLN